MIGGKFEITTTCSPPGGGRAAVYGPEIYQHLTVERTLRRSPDGVSLDIYNQPAQVSRGYILQVHVDGALFVEAQVVRTDIDNTSVDQKMTLKAGDGALVWHQQVLSFSIDAGDTLHDAITRAANAAGLAVGFVDPSIGDRAAAWTTNIVGSFRQVMTDLVSFEPEARWTIINGVLEVYGPGATRVTVPAFELTGLTPFATMPSKSGDRLTFVTVFDPGLTPGVAVVDSAGLVGTRGAKFRVVKTTHELDQGGRTATTTVEAQVV